ncbi:MAG: hypothetical protein KIT79_08315 [Deltaproteobacteria bacterium]|nr:hypothetical protein [Deltaproteobacteria bacterium]
MPRGKKHDPKLRDEAYRLFAGDLTNAEVARKLRLPETTTVEWHKSWSGSEEFETYRRHKRAERLQMANRLQAAAAIRLLQAVMEGMIPPERLPVAYGIVTDKCLLMEGEPTQRMEYQMRPDEEEDLLKRLEALIEDQQ